MAVRPMKVWNAATSTWDDVAVSQRGDVVNKTDFAAKGDIIAGTGASAYDNLPAGSNGEVLTADSTTASGLRWQPAYNAGRNRIINSDFSVWQRGTSITVPNGTATYTADRWRAVCNFTAGSASLSRQSFTAGTAPEAGYEGTYFARMTVGSTVTYFDLVQLIEDVRTFAGQTVTLSFWAKASVNTSMGLQLRQSFGSGGSSDVDTGFSGATVTTSWQRFTRTVTLPSVSGKTIGASSWLGLFLFCTSPTGSQTFDIWGVQVEAGNVATRFEEEPYEATLRKCQRYYYRATSAASTSIAATGYNRTTTVAQHFFHFPVIMRTRPTALEQSGTAGDYSVLHGNTATTCSAVPAYDSGEVWGSAVQLTVASGLTAGDGSMARSLSTNAYFAWSAEL